MQTNPVALLHVLRCELDATNQQFVHILALKLRGEQQAARRITEVDDVDFANAIRIIDYLVATNTPIVLPAGLCVPGTDYLSMLISERAMEARMREAIARFCSGVAEYYQSFSFSRWQPQTPHPAADSNPAVFHSFEATLSKFVS
ncbi:MAG: hypothetical protein GY875_03380 [Gammaproteobacteria bacterium]|nr:hypothetical protein [Gammaproteobacteria bacterium]